jgi:DNA mismatch repair protein MutS2
MISENTLELLEFSKLLRLISDFANSDASRASVAQIRPLGDRTGIEQRLQQVYEIRRMSHEGKPLGLSPFPDISGLLVRIRPEGAVLEAVELADFIPFLDIANTLSEQINERRDLPYLNRVAGHLTGFPDILKVLGKSVDFEGNILDSASPLLAELRAKIRRLEARIRKNLEEMVRDERLSALLQDDFITTRSGRWVIPVRMDSKGMVPGVVHDISKSGETAFVEPLGIINLANELENLVAEQKAEEIRILRNICSIIRKVIDRVEDEFRTVVKLDALACVAKFADLLNMQTPQMNDTNVIDMRGARHPLLELSLRKANRACEIVPLDVSLGGADTVMVITGANAGGKTIAIKTIGLLLLMGLSGMPVPAESSSGIPLIQNLLADIGDEQSIENNLSTFSAHISNVSEILLKKDSGTVVLLDELGTGTDPEEGAALACSILKDLRKSGALVFATTHLSDIKGFVHRTDGMINASMEFDLNTLTPLYRLRTGEPGQSHALEIALRYGLPDSLIDEAKRMLGRTKVDFDNMIADLNLKRAEYENSLKDIRKQKAEVEEKNRRTEEMLADLKYKQKGVLADAYREASDLISNTKRQMNAFLNEIRKQEKSERQRIVKEVEAVQESVVEKLREFEVADCRVPSIDDIKESDVVYVRSLGYDASVIDVNRKSNRLKVMAHNMEVEVPLSDIRFKSGKPLPAAKAAIPSSEQADEPVSSRINLVGLRVDEALSRLEHFLNHASLDELREVTIIHGVGKGLLMKAVREHLTEHPLVKNFRSGTTEEGSVGVTMATMK